MQPSQAHIAAGSIGSHHISSLSRHMMGWPAVELSVITLMGLLFVLCFPVNGISSLSAGPEFHVFDPHVRLDALEHERLSGVLLPVEIGLRRYGHIPTWNPYLGTGEPTLNNPFNYLFNPFASVPVLLFGGIQGTKVTIILTLLLAGYNMWALARVIGIGSVGRVTAGALYLMSGGIGGKFHAGHFQLGLSLAWMPLVFAGLWWTLRSSDRRAPVLMAIAFALLFFAGNIYYTLHTLVGMAVIFAFHIVDRNPEQGNLQLRVDRLRRVAVGGIFAFGLSALQFMPVWAVREFIGGHPGDPYLTSRYDLGQALANFTFPWPNWIIFEDPSYKMIVGVDYAYIGPAVFLVIVSAAALRLARPDLKVNLAGKPAAIALVLALIMMVWGAGQTPVVQYLYANIPRLEEFRFVGRAHAVAALWWLVLAALSVDVLWKATQPITPTLRSRTRLLTAMLLGGIVWAIFFAYSLQNDAGRAAMLRYDYYTKNILDIRAFGTFTDAALGLFVLTFAALVGDSVLLLIGRLRPMVRQRQIIMAGYGAHVLRLLVLGGVFLALADIMQVNSTVYGFLRRVSDFSQLYPYVLEIDTATPSPAIYEPHSPFAFSAYEAEMRNWGLNEGWTPRTPPSVVGSEENTIQYIPRWAVVWNELGGTNLAAQFVDEHQYQLRLCSSTEIKNFLAAECNPGATGTTLLYELPDALPYTFVIEDNGVFTPRDTVTQTASVLAHEQDRIVIRAETPGEPSTGHYLVVQETHFPGWLAFIEDAPVETVSVGPFTGVPMLPGKHTYTLRFEPPGMATGVVIFLITLAAIGIYVSREQPMSSVSSVP